MVKTLESHNYIEKIFETWISEIDNFTSEIQTKKSLIAFSSILLQDPATLNPLIVANIKIIMNQITKLSSSLYDKSKKVKEPNTTAKPDLDTYLHNVSFVN
jgi:hypothetical protein